MATANSKTKTKINADLITRLRQKALYTRLNVSVLSISHRMINKYFSLIGDCNICLSIANSKLLNFQSQKKGHAFMPLATLRQEVVLLASWKNCMLQRVVTAPSTNSPHLTPRSSRRSDRRLPSTTTQISHCLYHHACHVSASSFFNSWLRPWLSDVA